MPPATEPLPDRKNATTGRIGGRRAIPRRPANEGKEEQTMSTKIPDRPHYAVIETRHITIPGDERSRTNPGHGYPEHTEECISYHAFADEREMRAWVERKEERTRHYADYGNYRIVFVQPAKVEISTNVTITKP